MNKSAKTAKGNSADGEAAAAAAARGDKTAMGKCGLEAQGALHCIWNHPRQMDDVKGITALSPSVWDC